MSINLNVLSSALSWPSVTWLVWRHKWWIAAAVVAGALAGGITGTLFKKEYTASALVLVEPQKVPDKFVESSVSTDVQDRLATITQQILSNTKLQKIIDDFHLYADERRRMYPEDVLELMRTNINIKLEKGWTRDKPGAFHVTYIGSDPAITAEVVNRIVSLFLEENLRERESSAEGTADFLDGQLQDARRKLEVQEKNLAEYKLKHKGDLPGQDQLLNGALTRLEMELAGTQEALARANETRIAIESALKIAESSELEVTQMLERPQSSAETLGEVKTSERMAAQIDMMKRRYTPVHPDVVAMEREFAAVRQREAAEAKRKPEQRASSEPRTNPQTLQYRLQMRERIEALKTQSRLTEDEIASRTRQREQILASIADYQARLEQLPVRELQMGAITRDYEMSLANYRSLLDKRLSAQMSTEMERRQKGETFQILDPARIPQKPLGWTRQAIAAIGAVAGLLLGAALALAAGLAKNVVLGDWEAPPSLEILARIPKATPVDDNLARRGTRRLRRRLAVGLTASAAIIVTAALLAFFGKVQL